MSDLEYDIQKLAELSAVPRRTIYFYTQQGIIPPPHGAGLGARYGEIHLLRLRLIPHLRRQGLRLDEIRQRLDGMDLAAMRQRLAEAIHSAAGAAFTGPGDRGCQEYIHPLPTARGLHPYCTGRPGCRDAA